MDDPVSSERRNLIKAGAATLAAPLIATATQEVAAAGSQAEAKVFNLWVISDQHIGTDKAASAGILHGLVGFKPPLYFETLAEALRQSENSGAFGGPPIPWDKFQPCWLA
jgi:hypothetical protein